MGHRLTAALVVAFAALCAGTAAAAVQVLGGGYAERCWRATQGHAGASTRDCDLALSQEVLRPPDRAATFVNRGVLRLRARSLDAAVADFDRALRIRPGLGEALVNRGAARAAQRRWDAALADLDRGLASGVGEPEKAWFNKGLAHEGKGDLRAAYDAYRRAAELKPGWPEPDRELRRFQVRPAN